MEGSMTDQKRPRQPRESKDTKPLSIVSLSHYRQAYGLTLEDMVKRSGLSRMTVIRIEKGEGIKVKSLAKYMRALNCELKISFKPKKKGTDLAATGSDATTGLSDPPEGGQDGKA